MLENDKKIKFILIIYTIYCAYIIGTSWDESYYHEIGKINLNYLLSFGIIDEPFHYKWRFSTLYWSISSLISQILPKKFNLEIYHIINASVGLMTIVGLYKINKILFNKFIAKVSSYLLFLIPFINFPKVYRQMDILLNFHNHLML